MIDLHDIFYAYGKVAHIFMARPSKCAFVEYSNRAEAELAASQLYNALMVKGRALTLSWAKPRTQAVVKGNALEEGVLGAGSCPSSAIMPPPPGMEGARPSAYALPGMTVPVVQTQFAGGYPPQILPNSNEGLEV